MVDNPGVELIAELGGAPTEVGRARRAVGQALGAWGVTGDALELAVLLTSEVVTNAIRHGVPPVALRAGFTPRGAVRVEVRDLRPGQVVPMEQDLWAVDGRGLQMVDLMSDRWGCRSDLDGKRVWFDVLPDGAAVDDSGDEDASDEGPAPDSPAHDSPAHDGPSDQG